MEFITAEQFLKESKEVQEVFIDWWKPSIGDLFWFETVNFYHLGLITHEKIKVFQTDCPAFTEGQLRKFIEDKTEKKITIIEFDYDHWNIVSKFGFAYITDESDLLQAYWKVAVQIAKEEVLNEKNNKNNK